MFTIPSVRFANHQNVLLIYILTVVVRCIIPNPRWHRPLQMVAIYHLAIFPRALNQHRQGSPASRFANHQSVLPICFLTVVLLCTILLNPRTTPSSLAHLEGRQFSPHRRCATSSSPSSHPSSFWSKSISLLKLSSFPCELFTSPSSWRSRQFSILMRFNSLHRLLSHQEKKIHC
jgi:hypothetical protein